VLTDIAADRLAEIVLSSVARPYPYKSGAVLHDDRDVVAPRQLTPLFFGCFDWHSAVHSHWTLARLARLRAERPWHRRALEHFENTFTDEAIATELAFLTAQPSFELPYGLAWLLTLCDELRHDFHSQPWGRRLRPLEELAGDRLEVWLRGLSHPIRSGQHTQSSFAMTLALRWAHDHRPSFAKLIRRRALEFHESDRDAPLHFEPSAYDFLSPSLGIAELMAEVLPPGDFARWLRQFAPHLENTSALQPVHTGDRSDGREAHFDGLNLSRAWMLRNIARALPDDDPRAQTLAKHAERHAERGLEALDSDEYAVTHWLPTFIVYWLTDAG